MVMVRVSETTLAEVPVEGRRTALNDCRDSYGLQVTIVCGI